jgi:hypothetical protein
MIRIPGVCQIAVLMLALAWVAPARAGSLKIITKCPPDAVLVGQTCVDKYEESVWQIDVANTSLIKRVQQGKATLADLQGGGAVQLGCPSAPWNATAYPGNFPAGGQWTPALGSEPPSPGVYAVSVPGVLPSTCIDWFQAAQACALSGKRLVANREWQDAAAGTPDPGEADDGSTTCATNSANPANTGARTNCKSSWGASDMVGNVWEWVANWGDVANGCTQWSASFGSDVSCMGGPGSGWSNLPGALIRGGLWVNGEAAGVFAVSGADPSFSADALGFRCAR